jgi:hypothetical protein
MQFDRIKRAFLVALLFTASWAFTPTKARAETVTLSCFSGAGIFVIDLSAGTVKLNSTGQTATNVAISENTISFVFDLPPVERTSWRIDRVSGRAELENYYYPGSPILTQKPFDSTQCEKISNKAF